MSVKDNEHKEEVLTCIQQWYTMTTIFILQSYLKFLPLSDFHRINWTAQRHASDFHRGNSHDPTAQLHTRNFNRTKAHGHQNDLLDFGEPPHQV